jgi:periplasmic protein TonB
MAQILNPGRVSLADTIALGVAPTWTEVVALLGTIVDALDQGAPPFLVPSLSEISLQPAGHVRLDGGRADPRGAVAGLGRLLGSLLEHTIAPSELVAIGRFAQASPPVYASLRDVKNALTAFDVSDPRAELAAYYERAARVLGGLAPAAASDRAAEVRETPGDISPERPLDPVDQRPTAGIRWASWKLPGTVALVVVLLAVAWMGGHLVSSWVKPSEPTSTAPVPSAIPPREAADRPASTPQPGQVDSSRAGASPTESARAPSGRVEGTHPPTVSGPAAVPAAAAPRAPETAESERPSASRTAETSPSRISLPEVPTPMAHTDAQPVPLLQTAVYSAADADVRPPQLERPQLPTERLRGITDEVAGDLELLVLEDGSVGEVRLVPPSNRVQDRMLLSAAKAWRFRPAERAGRVVKYRVRIPITW